MGKVFKFHNDLDTDQIASLPNTCFCRQSMT